VIFFRRGFLTNTDIHGTSYVKTKSKNSAVVAYRNQDGEIDIGIVASFSLKEGKKECYAILQRLPATDPHEWATSEKRREKVILNLLNDWFLPVQRPGNTMPYKAVNVKEIICQCLLVTYENHTFAVLRRNAVES